MERDVGKLIDIPGEITSAAIGHIVASAEDIYDYNQEEYQEIINSRLQSQINGMENTINPIPLDLINIICN